MEQLRSVAVDSRIGIVRMALAGAVALVLLVGARSARADKGATVTSLSQSSSNSQYGASIQFTVRVEPVAPSTVVPAGPVLLLDGSATLETGVLDDAGVARIPVPALPAGSHTLSASYAGGNDDFGSMSNVITHVVTKSGATVSLAIVPNPAVYGQAVTFTAVAKSWLGTATPPPTGSVSFAELVDGGADLGSAPLDANGAATLSSAALSPGQHRIFAVYSGDANHVAGPGNALWLTVEAPPPAFPDGGIVEAGVGDASRDLVDSADASPPSELDGGGEPPVADPFFLSAGGGCGCMTPSGRAPTGVALLGAGGAGAVALLRARRRRTR